MPHALNVIYFGSTVFPNPWKNKFAAYALVFLFWAGTTKVSADVLYVANDMDSTILKVAANGTSTVFANTGLNQPWSMAFDSGRSLYVANAYDNTITKFAPDGSHTLFADFGSTLLFAVATDRSDNLYVSLGNEIYKYNSAGINLGLFANGFPLCQGMACDSAGNLYAANLMQNRIEKYTSDGTHTIFGTGVTSPYTLAFDANSNLYVTAGDNSIYKYDSTGAYLGVFATLTGVGNSPYGLAIDSAGNVYAAVANNHSVWKFGANGADLGAFISHAGFPTAVAFEPSAVPEPSTYALLLCGGLLILLRFPFLPQHNK
ncbi:MAG: NHL repeat-containing protein [Verrucomicrobiota bacterium]